MTKKQLPDVVLMTPHGGLPCGHWPNDELVRYLLSTPAREAADELLASLWACVPFADESGMINGVNIFAAIAKAEGRT